MAFHNLRNFHLTDETSSETHNHEESIAIKNYMQELLANFNALRRACNSVNDEEEEQQFCKFIFWDLVAISARDEQQQRAFEVQIEKKLARKELPKNVPYLVICDPQGKKIGNGGSTLYILDKLNAQFGDALFEMKILLIHAGGSSQRLPTASVLGKLFTPLPIGNPMYQMLDLKLAMYLPFLKRMAPGVLVTCSDDIETYWLDNTDCDTAECIWSFEEQGFVALAHKSDVETGKQHGVYVLPYANFDVDAIITFGECLQVLQKPSAKTMDLKGAIIEGFGVCTDSIFYFSKDVVHKFLDFYKNVKPIDCEVDAYNDFLQALGKNANVDYIHNARNKSMASKTLTHLRQKLYLLLHNTPLNILLLHWSRFYHLGTSVEYIDNLTYNDQRNLFLDLSFNNWTCSKEIPVTNEESIRIKFSRLTVIHSLLENSVDCSSGPAVIEYCKIRGPINIGEYCLLSYCTVESVIPLIIPSRTILHTVPVNTDKRNGFVTVSFGIDDDLKANYTTFDANNMLYFGKRMGELLNHLMVKNVLELFDERDERCSLWNAKLFLLCDTASVSFLTTLSQVLAINGGKEENNRDGKKIGESLRLSMSDIIKYNDIKMMLQLRENLYREIVSDDDDKGTTK